VVAGLADALVVHQDSVDVLARARSHWQLSLRHGRGGLGNTNSRAVGVPIDADAGLLISAVDGVGGADTTLSVDVVESSEADALESVEVELLVGSAGGSADSQLGVVDVRGSTFSAGTLDQVESREAGADIIDQLLVEPTSRDYRSWRYRGRVVNCTALSGLVDVALGALAGEGGDDIGGVGGADIAESTDEEESIGADAAFVAVYLVSATDGVAFDVGIAGTIGHVVPQDADALAEDVVVDLVDGASDGGGDRSGRGGDVG
jgi:hypothetical protein